ncbi:MAG TPA: hypothetical protein VGP57_11090 [Actinoplanes sp.]|jgi:hypothetical protein|nr:hypothetical protein [Actinoplanes sp.]
MRAPRLGRPDRPRIPDRRAAVAAPGSGAVGSDELTESLLAERDELDAAGRL